jgi:hypothetical protein
MRVAVAPFRDTRPRDERRVSFAWADLFRDRTGDHPFELRDVGGGISEALAAHFNHVGLFKAADGVDRCGELPSAEALGEMRALGYDALLTGTVTHFYGVGYRLAMDIVVGSFLGAAVLPNLHPHEGYVELMDVRLTGTDSGEVLWSGTFTRKTRLEYHATQPIRAACDTLKAVANEMIKEMEAVEF